MLLNSLEVALAAVWQHIRLVPKEWQALQHDNQHLLAIDAYEYFDEFLRSGTASQENLLYHYELGVYGATIPHTEYWSVESETLPVKVITDWSGRKSPYALLPKFGIKQRGLLITHLLICLSYSRLKTELTMANITPINARDVPIHVRAAKTALNFVLNMTEAMFRHRNTLNDSAYDKAMDTTKKILRNSLEQPETRRFLGSQQDIWKELMTCLRQALPEIERQSCVPLDSTATGQDNSYAALMVSNQVCLMKDLEKLNDFISIARNIVGRDVAQTLAATEKFDQQVLKFVNLCVRVTSRCYDGNASPRVETQWTTIITAFKKLLVTCLQFLHNLIQDNEHRKLLLWLDLFGSSKSSHPDLEFTRTSPVSLEMDQGVMTAAPLETEPSTTEDFKNGFPTTGVPVPTDADMQTAMDKLGHGAGLSESLTQSEKTTTFGNVRDYIITACERTAAEQNGMAQATLQPVDPSGVDRQPKGKWDWTKVPLKDYSSEGIRGSDTIITKDPDAAAKTLREAKEQLMTRLSKGGENVEDSAAPESGTLRNREEVNGSDVATNGSGEEDEQLGEERGLFTDIPLVLGPDEMDALPLIIKAGICPSAVTPTDPKEAIERKHMQAVRCNILLAQDAGRNLLRELLIFIAAWEFGEEDFYFKLMLQIMDAILNNGLMPFAYQTFGEIKDIVSPAQSIIIKILTQLFRKKQSAPAPHGYKAPHGSPPVAPSRADLLIVRYIFTVFRQSIIPETCALIYLQGQIRLGVAHPDDFPLNWWDMERVYEGVYQFLEFFAVLTENEMWKEMLVKWEIVSELVTLLRELDASIPKAPLTPAQTAREEAESAGNPPASTPAPGQVERPYDPISTDEPGPATYDAEASAPESPSRDLDNPDPADFEWRNLKKLVVLVLSSLVWKSIPVQNQIRQYGGVEMILNCCNYDANNPYIREHAIMCLRFLLENSPKNQKIVEGLEARKTVPSEVLDSKGYETFIDADGKVGLRPKDVGAEAGKVPSGEVD
ncbi:copper transport protein [Trapelia coarctata]|nr:copper transport protein [Trapelia coarctata]